MQRTFLRSKIHRATVTDSNLNYEGSITIDSDLLKAADILPYEKVDVVNINNGFRFSTYAIKGRPGSAEICLNGAAARLAEVGDRIIIISYAHLLPDEIENHTAKAVLLDDGNRIKSIQNEPIK